MRLERTAGLSRGGAGVRCLSTLIKATLPALRGCRNVLARLGADRISGGTDIEGASMHLDRACEHFSGDRPAGTVLEDGFMGPHACFRAKAVARSFGCAPADSSAPPCSHFIV